MDILLYDLQTLWKRRKACQGTYYSRKSLAPQKTWRKAIVYSSLPKNYPKRSPKGIYDNTILCGNCERIFSPWDDYAQSLILRNIENNNYIIEDEIKVCFVIEDFDYLKLKLFYHFPSLASLSFKS
jgi:hypothetical protein